MTTMPGRSAQHIVIVAGPNGAGKTTFAREFLPAIAKVPRFINVDLIATGLSPFAPNEAAIRAGQIMLEEMAAAVAHRYSFAFETTLAGRAYLQRIADWRQLGYRVTLFFLSLPDVRMAIERVASRVAQGGHDIPEAVIRRRFKAGRINFEQHYRQAVDHWLLYDNAGAFPYCGRKV